MRRHPSLKAPPPRGGRGHGLDNLVARRTRLLTEPLDFEAFLTRSQRLGVTPEQAEEGFARGSLIQSASEVGEGGARSGGSWPAVLEPLSGPLDEAMQVHKAGFGRRLRRRQASPGAVFELLGDLATRRQEGVTVRMGHLWMCEHMGCSMREVVEATRAQRLGAQFINGLGPCAAPVLAQGPGSSQGADELLEHLGHGLARPRLGHRHGEGMHVLEPRGPGLPGVMASGEGQDRQELACAKRDGDSDAPEDTLGEGSGAEKVCGEGAGLVPPRKREPGDPMAHGLRTGRCGQPQGGRPHAEETADGSEADARPDKELQGDVHEIDWTFAGGPQGSWGLHAQRRLGLPGAFLLGISRARQALEFLAHGAMVIGAALGFWLPALSTGLDFGSGTHGGRGPSLASEVESHDLLVALESRRQAV
jgi:hypothetical protein